MRQRVGRSGRRGSAAVLRVYVQEPEITANTPPHDQLRENLVQSIAMVRLLAERWYEPPTAGSLHLSTLVQQTLSLIAQHGGARADQMWSALCRTGPFADVDAAMFARFLRDLSRHGLISQTHDGEVILDLEGERLVNHYDFFSAFTTTEEYRLVSGARSLGTVPVTYPLVLDMHILFGGRRWRITGVDVERKIVELVPAGGGRAPSFGGSPALVHDRVRQEMRRVLASNDRPPFVGATGIELLSEGRATYRRLEMDRNGLVPWGRGALMFPWAGDRAMHTIVLELLRRGVPASTEGIAIAIDSMSPDDVAAHLRDLVAAGPADAFSLAASVENKSGAKHHAFLGVELLSADYASSHLDTIGAHKVLVSVVRAC